ncbi:MAG: hypothetical protein AVDCRST_MAG66-461, partial [uncultured Pseudonocardia sp.]
WVRPTTPGGTRRAPPPSRWSPPTGAAGGRSWTRRAPRSRCP